jgi:glycosyltransferase involved in cell wall biosynthesis
MRLLITTDTIGGVWTFSIELVRGLLERGCAIALVSFGRPPSSGQQRNCDEFTERFSERFLYVASDTPLEWMEANSSAFTEAAPLLARIGNNFNADLLHSSQFCFGALDLPIPKLVTVHSDVLSWAQSCGQTLAESRWLQQYLSLVRAGLAGAAAVAAPTHWMMHALETLYPLPQTRLVIPNGRTVPPSHNEVRMLQAITAGRLWDPAKDLCLLTNVQSPGPILVAGEMEHELSVISPMSGSLKLLGKIGQDQLLGLFCQSSVYLCTSIYEPFGLAPLEAALCGCAVLARDIPSLNEVWQDGALYFRDAASLSLLLQRLYSSPDALHEIQMRSSLRAQHFTRDRMVDQYLALFETTIAKSMEVHCVG